MPIRFRCSHCQQLLGIARRKSGSFVHCPTCNASLLVPANDELPPVPEDSPRPSSDPAAPAAGAAAPGLFDRDDFDALLKFSVSGPVEPRKFATGPTHTPAPASRNPPVEPAVPPPPLPMAAQVNVEPWPAARVPPPAPAPGLILSPGIATVLTVVVILLIAVAFGAGLIVGRWLP